MKILSKRLGVRDQGVTAFSAILLRLCESSGAYAAALVDAGGETVDYAGRVAPFDIRVAAAELRIVLACIIESAGLGGTSAGELVVRSANHTFLVAPLGEGYAVVLILGRRAFRVSRRALAEAVVDLEREAGLTPNASKDRLRWLGVDVMTEPADPRRPRAVWHEGAWMPVLILGRYQSKDLGRGEVGYMTRFASGAERLLVREPFGRWFAGDPS